MKSVGIRGKLITAFLTFTVAIAFEGLLSINYMNDMAHLFDGMYHNNLVPLNDVKTLEASIRDNRLYTYQFLGTVDPDQMEALKARIEKNSRELLGTLATRGAEVANIKKEFDIYLDLNAKIVDMHYNFDTSGAYSAIAGESLAVYKKLMDLALALTESKRMKAEENLNSGHSIQETIFFVMIVVIVVSGALSFIVGFVLANNLIRPILKIRDSLHDLGKGILDKHLDRVVLERTDELGAMAKDYEVTQNNLAELISNIQAILQNIPQGILTVTEGNKVHPEYSNYLEEILKTDQIGGTDVMELLFNNSDLGADTLDQIKVGLSCVLGEDSMMFDMNSHLFISEFNRRLPDGKVSILEVDWSPILNKSDVCEKIMVTLRDVTDIRKLQEASKEQKRNLEIMLEILAVAPEKFLDFVLSSRKTLEENRQLIMKTSTKDPDVLATLFRNMHTVKGNARTYGFLHMTQIVHEAEQQYTDLREIENQEWNPKVLLHDIDEVQSLIEEYTSISTDQLGRKGADQAGADDEYAVVLTSMIDQMLREIETLDNQNIRAMQKVLAKIRTNLKQIGTVDLGSALHGIVNSLPSLAKDLEKEAPKVIIEDNGLHLKKEAESLLKNSFVHLFRNSLDHGIETPDIRKEAGKEPFGTIQLKMHMSDEGLEFSLRDDGRGLDLERLREKGEEKKIIKPGQEVSPDRLANLIFDSGFSTAKKITDVSGRGVGLDAVKKFFEKEGGSIRVELDNEGPNAKGYHSFSFVLTLPKTFAVPLNDENS